MRKRSLDAIDYRTNESICVEIENEYITNISTNCQKPEASIYIAPGLVDIQINGYRGVDLNQIGLTVPDVEQMTRMLCEEGVTTYFPTIISNNDEATESLLGVLSQACKAIPLVNECIGGIHLEGPFISCEDGPRGAHSRQYVKAPDWDLFSRWQAATDDKIRIVTLSPEWAGSIDFIHKCTASGVIVSIGHTAASPEQIRQAIGAGATMSTHLGNGSHLALPRHSNYIWEQLASENLWSTIIADGFHLPDSLLKVFLKVKPNTSILVSDATSFAGLPAGTYSSHIGGDVQLDSNGRLFIKGNPQILAGSAQSLLWCVNQLVKKNILALNEAWDMASIKPKSFLNQVSVDALQIGAPADLVLFNEGGNGIEIIKTIKSGNTIFNKY